MKNQESIDNILDYRSAKDFSLLKYKKFEQFLNKHACILNIIKKNRRKYINKNEKFSDKK